MVIGGVFTRAFRGLIVTKPPQEHLFHGYDREDPRAEMRRDNLQAPSCGYLRRTVLVQLWHDLLPGPGPG